MGRKRDVYATLGVTEYFLYDPRAEYLTPALQGYRLQGGRYRPLPTMTVLPDRGTTMRSEVLGLELRDLRDEQMLAGSGIPRPGAISPPTRSWRRPMKRRRPPAKPRKRASPSWKPVSATSSARSQYEYQYE